MRIAIEKWEGENRTEFSAEGSLEELLQLSTLTHEFNKAWTEIFGANSIWDVLMKWPFF